MHKKRMPFLAGARRLAVRAVRGAQFAFIGAERETLDRRSGRSRRRFFAGRPKENRLPSANSGSCAQTVGLRN